MYQKLIYNGLLISTLFICSCTKKQKEIRVPDPAFAEFVSAYTGGTISNGASVQIRFAESPGRKYPKNVPTDKILFEFNPEIKGDAIWSDDKTLVFNPSEPLKNGQIYDATLRLNKILYVPDHFKNFEFGFRVMNQSIAVSFDGFKAPEPGNTEFTDAAFTVETADLASTEDLDKIIKASLSNEDIKGEWSSKKPGRKNVLTYKNLPRDRAEFELVWDGNDLDFEGNGTYQMNIPNHDEFSVTHCAWYGSDDQIIKINFSNSLKSIQMTDGFVRLHPESSEVNSESDSGYTNLFETTVDGNNLFIYPNRRLSGNVNLSISNGITDFNGKVLNTQFSESHNFDVTLPSLRNVSDGVILPGNKLIFPFEAVMVKSVKVKVFRIAESNMTQFFQENNLEESSGLYRVGKIISDTRISLNNEEDKSYKGWKRYAIDLSKFIKAEPGALYRVSVEMDKQGVVCDCHGADNNSEDQLTAVAPKENDIEDDDDSEYNYYSEYDNYDYYSDPDYDWRERDNPCNPAYYSYERAVKQNILASDIGLILKKGTDKSYQVYAASITRAQPLTGVTIEIYDYTRELLRSGMTNSDGLLELTFRKDEKPYMLVAKKGKERGYLRIAPSDVLSVSSFETDGEEVRKGLKGFIYAERGVWRPGDSIFTAFILRDPYNTLPEYHPVVFEMTNPRGQLTERMVKSVSTGGFYRFATATPPDAPTGTYTVTIKAGGVRFTKNLKVETIKPNRLKIKQNFNSDVISLNNPNQKARLSVSWLTGAIASNLRLLVSAELSRKTTVFKGYDGYVFDNPEISYTTSEQVLFEGRTDETGNLEYTPHFATGGKLPGMLNALITTKVFEDGGDFSVDVSQLTISPYISYVGLKFPESSSGYTDMMETAKKNRISVVTLDESCKPVNRDFVSIKIYKLNWRWWWEASQNSDGGYLGADGAQLVKSFTVDTRNGKSDFTFEIGNDEWGRYYFVAEDPVSGHSAGKVMYMDWADWQSRSVSNDSKGASMLSFSLNKNTVKTNEEVIVRIPSDHVGAQALITVENGVKVLDHEWISLNEGMNEFRLAATAEMTPNVYIHVTLLNPYKVTEEGYVLRKYGIMPLQVENPDSRIEPLITMPDVLEPESEFSVSITEKSGREFTYTLAIVDDGLLDLTKFKTPDPYKALFAKEALGVKTWDLYDKVLGAYATRMSRLLTIGGDGQLDKGAAARARRFKPVVIYVGPFTVKAGKKAVHKLKMPNYIGSVRAMLVAGNKNGYGNAEKTVPVRKNLMVLGTIPRVAGINEEFDLPVTLFWMSKKTAGINVQVQTNQFMEIIGQSSKKVSFKNQGDATVYFRVKTRTAEGIGKIKITAKSGSESAVYEAELDVRNPNLPIRKSTEIVLKPGTKASVPYEIFGTPGSNKGTLELASSLTIDFAGRLSYLIQYPYGCGEQTTSSVFPQLYLADVCDLSSTEKNKTENNIREGIRRICSFQTYDGGFSYWQGEQFADNWVSSYAGHFLLEAKNKGYRVSDQVLRKWVRFQKKNALNFKPGRNVRYMENQAVMQSYRLYTLALAGEPELASMNRMKESGLLNTTARWQLAAAYVLSGQKETAHRLVNNIPSTVPSYNELSYTYGSTERDEAIILQTLTLMGEKTKGYQLAKKLASELNKNGWLSTQTTAFMLISLSKYTEGQANNGIKCLVQTAGTSNSDVESKKSMVRFDIPVEKQKKSLVQIHNKGTGPLYVRFTLEGKPSENEPAITEPILKLDVKYFGMNGSSLNPSEIEQGTDFYAEITVGNTGAAGDLEQLALKQVVASGWQIANDKQLADTDNSSERLYTYRDIRDDRILTFFNLSAGKSKSFRIKLNATYTGEFYLPGILCEAMYDGSIQSRTNGLRIKVIPHKQKDRII